MTSFANYRNLARRAQSIGDDAGELAMLQKALTFDTRECSQDTLNDVYERIQRLNKPRVVHQLTTGAPRSQRRYLRVVFEVEMDNTAAMFRRDSFDKRIQACVAEFNSCAKLGGPIVHATTEDMGS